MKKPKANRLTIVKGTGTKRIKLDDGTIRIIRLSEINKHLQSFSDAETGKYLKDDLLSQKSFCALEILHVAQKFSNEFSQEIRKQAELIIAIDLAEAVGGYVACFTDSEELIVYKPQERGPYIIIAAKFSATFVDSNSREGDFGDSVLAIETLADEPTSVE